MCCEAPLRFCVENTRNKKGGVAFHVSTELELKP